MKQQLSEKQIQQLVIQWLRYNGFYCIRLNSGMIRSQDSRGKQRMIRLAEVGTPDVMAFKNGYCTNLGCAALCERLYFFEIKRPKGKVTRMQEIKMQELASYGAKCYVIHSIEELQALNL